jgi:hypothetical protein
MKKFWSLNEKIHKMTWQDVYNSANKGEDKRGLAYTPLPREKYKSIAYIKNLSKDIDLFELRVDGGMRVHGYRQNAVFYICVLDKKHEICR